MTVTWETGADVSVPCDQAQSRLATLHSGAGVLSTGQGADGAGHGKPDNLLSLVIDDEVPRRLQPHCAACGPGGEEALRARALIPSEVNMRSNKISLWGGAPLT